MDRRVLQAKGGGSGAAAGGGRRVLNVGFGLGIIDAALQKQVPSPTHPFPSPRPPPCPQSPLSVPKVGPTIGSGYEPCPESTGVKVFTVGPAKTWQCDAITLPS